MTDTTNSSIYPTEWRVLDLQAESGGAAIECRQMTDDTFQLRSPTHIIMVNAEGFNLFRTQDVKKWNKWLVDNNIKSIPRVVFDD